LLNEKRLPLAARPLFVVFVFLATMLFCTIIIPSSGGEFIQEASTQEEEIADGEAERGGGGQPAGQVTPEQLPSPTTPPQEPPNILLIISDDQPFYTKQYTPAIANETFAKGTTFSDAFLSTSLCCPSRASILTGLYAHNHGVMTNSDPLTNTTFFQAIDTANLDYRTAMVGKYLNSWSGDCRSEFDYWVAFPNQRPWYNGTDKPLNVNCNWMKFNNVYSTYLLRDYALQFLNATINEGKPFVMWFSPFNPHAPATPAQEDVNLYQNGLPSYYLPPSFNEEDVSDKPAWVQALPFRWQDKRAPAIEVYKKEQLSIVRNLASFDRAVNALLSFLDSKGELSNTLVIYISDNGYQLGEHRILKKNTHYKESSKAIMGARWDDGHIPIGETSYELVGNIDIAPTIYDVLGLTPPYLLDGRSLLDLWRGGSEPWRQSFLLEHWNSTTPVRELSNQNEATIVTKSWSYTETKGDKSELYNREQDPYEMNNLWCSPDDPSCAYSEIITELASELRLLYPSWDNR
jgi:N-acetylglucosamine-6-sulfatase